MMGAKIGQILLIIYMIISTILAQDNDLVSLQALKDAWKNTPPSWNDASDPCSGSWDGITCTQGRVTKITLSSMQLSGELPGDIEQFTELQILDLSYNKNLTGSLTSKIGNLRKLITLILVGCSFSGPIPDTIGNLENLMFLSLNSNNFIGSIPPAVGNLKNLYWLDLSANKLTGSIPVSNWKMPAGLDNLTHAKHFHLGDNQLSGSIPLKLFNANTKLIHLDLSNNTFDPSDVPSWLSTLQALTTIKMHNTNLGGELPATLFNIPQLQNVDLSNNQITGTLNIGSNPSTQLELVDLRINNIADFTQRHRYDQLGIGLILLENPICTESGVNEAFCSLPTNSTLSYSTPSINCEPPSCVSGLVLSPKCQCAIPYTGLFFFKAPSFSSLENSTIYIDLHDSLMNFFKTTVDSVSLTNVSRNAEDYLVIKVEFFPYRETNFNRTEILGLGFALSNQTFKPSKVFNTYTFVADRYDNFSSEISGTEDTRHKSSNNGIIIGSVIGGCVLMVLLVFVGIYAFCRTEQAARAPQQSEPFEGAKEV